MTGISHFFKNLFGTSDWPARWNCGNWTEFHGWLFIISDLFIWLAYFTLPVVILSFLVKKKEKESYLTNLYILFASFILACGATHFIDALTFWVPLYRLNALLRFITAIISCVTVYYVIKKLPKTLAIRSLKDLEAELEERKKAEAKIIELNKTLKQSVVDRTAEISAYRYALDESSIVAITDQMGIIKHVNTNFCKISKYSSHELIGQDHRIINSGHHSKEYIKNLWQTISKGNIWKGELKNKAKDGSIYWVDTTIVPFLDENNKPFQYMAIRSDITERKTIEENLLKTLKELSDYKFAIDQSSIVAVTDQKGVISYVNEQFCKISGYSKLELIGQDHRLINSGYHPKEFFTDLWRTIANGKIWRGEVRNKAKDGTIYWVDTTIVPFLNAQEKPFQYLAIRSDITTRKISETKQLELEEEIKLKAEELVNVLERIADGFLVLDTNFCYTYANKKIGELTGRNSQDLIGKNIWDEFPEAVNTKTYHAFLKAMDEKVPVKNIDYFEPFDLWQENHIYPGKGGLSVFIRDITTQKRAEQELAKSERIYRTIASSIPGSVILLFDSNHRYTLVEGDMISKLGFNKDQILNKTIKDVLPPTNYDKISANLARAFNGEEVTYESIYNNYEMITRFVPLKNEENLIYAVMVVGIDVTKLKKAQRHVEEVNSALEKKVTERTAQLERVNKQLESFSYSVAHDLRAPLRALSGYSSILIEDYEKVLDKEGKRFLNEIDFNAKKMGILIDDLLKFSRLGRKEIQVDTIEMKELLDNCFSELQVITRVFPEIKTHTLHNLKADSALIKHVLINLLSNAIKYSHTKPNPKIEISSELTENEIIYSIKDNGVGFDMAFAHKLFGVFQRLHSDDEFEGTGVGLAIVQRIIEKHQGRVWAESSLGEGATFYFSIPN